MNDQPAILVLADGTVFEGEAIGASGCGVGELVFNTAMTGYQEILSDPSYAKQIITLTMSHVGNVGCNSQDLESTKSWAAGLVVRDYCEFYSNYRAQQSLSSWLIANGIVGISGVDTRYLTQKLRDYGAISACVSTKVDDVAYALLQAQNFEGLVGLDLAQQVSRQTIKVWPGSCNDARYHVVAYDFGIKHSILKILAKLGCKITLVPAKTSAYDVLAMQPDGVFLSNGPGDPAACDYAIDATKIFLDADIPLFGICLGFQILALACNAQALKMKCGHHGANHPVIERFDAKRVFITSQNHGFAIDEASLPNELIATHHSLFDGSLQGIMHRDKPAFGFQGHPEAGPGPHDAAVLFDFFIHLMNQRS